jgi:Golgi nucleoside diphosphatase
VNSKAREQFEILLTYCKNKIPESSHYSTILLLKATAGLRLLTPKHQDAIIQSIREYLSKSTFKRFQDHKTWASVMSGQEEGVGGWITTNYLTSSFFPGNNHTYGALGMSCEVSIFV